MLQQKMYIREFRIFMILKQKIEKIMNMILDYTILTGIEFISWFPLFIL